jgi:hypothetical protein
LLSAILVVAALPALDAKSKKKKSTKSEWVWDVELEATSRYDSNIFKFSDSQTSRFDQGRASDKTSGRFDDIRDTDDLILTPYFGIIVTGEGLLGKTFEVTADAKVKYYTFNPAKSYPGFGFEVSQSLGGGKELDFDLGYSVDRFSRNHLSGASDLTGNVSASERVYSPGIFDSGSAQLKYSQRLWERSKKRQSVLEDIGLREIEGAVRVGYGMRDYESPFSKRDRDELTPGFDIDFQIAKSWRLDLGYRFRYIDTANGREVMIRDETGFGVDLNGDLDATDENRRTVQRSDRSRIDHGVKLELGWEFAKRWDTWVGYEITLQEFLSRERFDLSYRDRKDIRHVVYTGLEWKFSTHWAARVEGEWTTEQSERLSIGDEDEETEYDRYVVYMSLAVRF